MRAEGNAARPLPPHKFGPHDVVALRPSKGDGGGAPLAEGIVYRLKDEQVSLLPSLGWGRSPP